MQRLAFTASAVLFLTACQGGPPPERFESPEDGFSIHRLDEGWTQSRDKGSVVFRGSAQAGFGRTTIVVRSVPVTSANQGTRGAREVVAATGHVIDALPGVTVHDQHATTHKRYDARTFELTYTPKSRGVPYERRHVVLTGDLKHIYHVMLTAPEGELDNAAGLFDDLVGSLQGEG